MRTFIPALLLVMANTVVPTSAGDANVDLMQREILRLNAEIARLREQLQNARDAAPPREKEAAEPVKQAAEPVKRAEVPRATPKSRDCPACKRGKVYGVVTDAVPVWVPGWGWHVTYFTRRAPIGVCPACGGAGRVTTSLANQ